MAGRSAPQVGGLGCVPVRSGVVTEVDEDAEAYDAYLDKSASVGRMSKAVDFLIAATCILRSRGELNVSTSMVDDEGVDLAFPRRDSSTSLAMQVKARTSDSKGVRSGSFVTFVRSQTFRPCADLKMLFAAVDTTDGAVMKVWLVPSEDFAATLGEPNSRGAFASWPR